MDQRQIELAQFRVWAGTSRPRSVRLYRSARSFLGHALFCLALTIGVAIFQYDSLVADGELTLWGRAFSLGPALAWLNLIRVYFDNVYVFRERLVLHFHGRLSLSLAMPVIYYSDIREIRVFQGVLGRMLNFGDVEIGTAAGVGVRLRGVKKPEVVARFVERMRMLTLLPKAPIEKRAA